MCVHWGDGTGFNFKFLLHTKIIFTAAESWVAPAKVAVAKVLLSASGQDLLEIEQAPSLDGPCHCPWAASHPVCAGLAEPWGPIAAQSLLGPGILASPRAYWVREPCSSSPPSRFPCAQPAACPLRQFQRESPCSR